MVCVIERPAPPWKRCSVLDGVRSLLSQAAPQLLHGAPPLRRRPRQLLERLGGGGQAPRFRALAGRPDQALGKRCQASRGNCLPSTSSRGSPALLSIGQNNVSRICRVLEGGGRDREIMLGDEEALRCRSRSVAKRATAHRPTASALSNYANKTASRAPDHGVSSELSIAPRWILDPDFAGIACGPPRGNLGAFSRICREKFRVKEPIFPLTRTRRRLSMGLTRIRQNERSSSRNRLDNRCRTRRAGQGRASYSMEPLHYAAAPTGLSRLAGGGADQGRKVVLATVRRLDGGMRRAEMDPVPAYDQDHAISVRCPCARNPQAL